ncbi:hypothetical protein H9Q72_012227 [Fusarium xylarioides]|uniref:Uncharacterized protein n=1 Tax=Fusarium xylarioides TaxID=221167 RepID=A0A9P7KZY2_9HYPO|nr:hypothetical protein H9Q72_012227 [Fusarium xylarioides]
MLWFAPFWKGKVNEFWTAAEQKFCEKLASSGRKSIGQPWFEYEVDRIVYLHFMNLVEKTAKNILKCEIPGWPWEYISAKDVTTQQDKKSVVYERYLEKQKVAAIAAKKNESAMEGVEGPAAAASNNLNPTAPAFEPSAEATSLEDGEIATSEEVQTQTVNSGQLPRRRGRNNRGLHDSMFARGHGSGRGRGSARGSRRGRGTHQPGVDRQPSSEDEFEWKKDDQEPSDQNNETLGASGSHVTETTQEDVDMETPLFVVDLIALKGQGIESSSFAPTRPHITNEAMLEDISNNGSDLQKRSRLWDKVYGNIAIRDPIVGPFEMKIPDCIPTQVYISEERLAKANGTYLRDAQITFNRQERRLTVGFAAKQGPGSFPSRMEIVNIWQAVKQWIQEVCSEIPSCLDDVIYRMMRKPTAVSDEAYRHAYSNFKDDAWNMPPRLREIGQQFTAMRQQLEPLLSADFGQTRAGIHQWLNSQPNPLRAIDAATAEWLMACNAEDEAKVFQWCEGAKGIVKERQGDKGTILK